MHVAEDDFAIPQRAVNLFVCKKCCCPTCSALNFAQFTTEPYEHAGKPFLRKAEYMLLGRVTTSSDINRVAAGDDTNIDVAAAPVGASMERDTSVSTDVATGVDASDGVELQMRQERANTEISLESRQDPQRLVGQRIEVVGKGAGLVTATESSFGKSTQHTVQFDSGETVTLLLKKREGGKGHKFYTFTGSG